MSKFVVEAGGEVVTCEFTEDISPETCQALKDLLPYKQYLACAKMAGDEVFLAVPFKFGLEKGGSDVMKLKAGSIVYWPNRPLLCLFHNAPQDETANISMVGRVIKNLDGLGRIIEKVQNHQGLEVTLLIAE